MTKTQTPITQNLKTFFEKLETIANKKHCHVGIMWQIVDKSKPEWEVKPVLIDIDCHTEYELEELHEEIMKIAQELEITLDIAQIWKYSRRYQIIY